MEVIKNFTTAKLDGDMQTYIVNQLADANQFNKNQEFLALQVTKLDANQKEADASILNTVAQNKLASENADIALGNDITVLQTKSDAIDILPNVAGISKIGSPTQKFGAVYTKELHIDANTLYVDGVAVIGSTAQTIQIGADNNQGIRVATTGTGQTILDSQSSTTIQTNGMNADVLVQTAGQGSRSRVSSATEIILTAPNTKVDGNGHVTGSLVVDGGLTVNGTVTAVNATDMVVTDNVITLNKGEIGSGVTKIYAGVQIDRGDLADSRIVWDESIDKFTAGVIGQEASLATEPFVVLGLDGKANVAHTHSVANVTGLQTALDGKLDNTANAVSASKLATARNIAGVAFDGTVNIAIPYSNLTGLPTLGTSASKNVSASGDATSLEVVKGDDTRLTNARTPVAHTHTLSSITDFPSTVSAVELGFLDSVSSNIQTQINGKQDSLGFIPENVANKGQANGYASLDANGTIPSVQLPSYVDDVLEYANLASFPVTGISGKIYVDLVTNKTYRWGGSTYTYITSGAVDSVNNKTGVVTLVKADVGLGSVDNTSDLAKPISTATQTALNGKVDDSQVLTNVPAGALFTDTVYTHPATHPASVIVQDLNNRFVTDAEKTSWNAKAPTTAVTTTTNGLMIATDKVKLDAISGTNTGDQTTITGNAGSATVLQTARTINGVSFNGSANITVNAVDATARIASSEKGVANGVATLDATGVIPTTQLPSFVDDVLEYTNLATFPAIGNTGKIYVDLATNKTYRWSGSVYVYITSGAVDSVAGKTGVVTLVKADVGLSLVDNTSDASKPVSTATQTALNGKANNATTLAGYGITDASLSTHTHAIATTLANGFMSSSDKIKLDASVNYSLPVASATVLGGVKAGTNISIDANGFISANDSSVAWTEITGKPTTVATSGLTDAVTTSQLTTLQNQVNAIDSEAIFATLQTVSFTATSGLEYIVTADAITVTLPSTPTTGMYVKLLDGTGAIASITLAGNGQNVEGSASFVVNSPAFQLRAVYVSATYGWRVFGF